MKFRIRKLPKPIRIVLFLFVGVGILFGLGNMALSSIFGMQDDEGIAALSPDGQYKAILHYNDGLTFGYQHVVLETGGGHLFGYGIADIVEVDEHGLLGLSWRDNRTLVIDYDATKRNDTLCDTGFVRQEKSWRDVKIEYHQSFATETTGSPPP